MRLTFKILIVLFVLAVTVSANVNAPTSWGRGYKLFNVNGSYWDLMNENGVQNGSLTNLTNISMKTPDALNATATILFTNTVNLNKSINASGEGYLFVNSSVIPKDSRIVDIKVSQNASYSCSQFVTEVNLNSSNFTASACSGNSTTLTSKWLGTPSNSYTTSTNETNITRTNFSGGRNYTLSYVDAPGSYDDNASSQDVIYRSTDKTNAMIERMRIKVNTSVGGGLVLSEVVLPTIRPASPVNGSAVWNISYAVLEVYQTGNWVYSGNGTVMP